jgi:hypothetical protein
MKVDNQKQKTTTKKAHATEKKLLPEVFLVQLLSVKKVLWVQIPPSAPLIEKCGLVRLNFNPKPLNFHLKLDFTPNIRDQASKCSSAISSINPTSTSPLFAVDSSSRPTSFIFLLGIILLLVRVSAIT